MPLEYIKVGSDVLLLVGLVWLGVRFLRAPSSAATRRHIADLEASLKDLMHEAERAGQNLNDQLVRRQHNLEKLLHELEAAEQRTARAVASAEGAKSELESRIERSRRVEVERTTIPTKEVTSSPQNLSDSARVIPAQTRNQENTRPVSRTNIYGEEIHPPAPTPRPMQTSAYRPSMPSELLRAGTPYNKATARYASRLANQIETQVIPAQSDLTRTGRSTPPRPPTPASQSAPIEQSLNEVYKSAEKMLRSGRDLATVSAATSLSEEDVAMISQIIESETPTVRESREVQLSESRQEAGAQSSTSTTVSDPRLGVLTGMKRQVQVL